MAVSALVTASGSTQGCPSQQRYLLWLREPQEVPLALLVPPAAFARDAPRCLAMQLQLQGQKPLQLPLVQPLPPQAMEAVQPVMAAAAAAAKQVLC